MATASSMPMGPAPMMAAWWRAMVMLVLWRTGALACPARGDRHECLSSTESRRLSLQPPLDFRFVRALDEELHRLAEVRRGVFNRIALAGNVQFRTERDEAVALAVDHCRESPY